MGPQPQNVVLRHGEHLGTREQGDFSEAWQMGARQVKFEFNDVWVGPITDVRDNSFADADVGTMIFMAL